MTHFKAQNIFVPVTVLSVVGILFSLVAQFYFYEAVIAFFAALPVFLSFFVRSPRVTLLASLILAICFNPGIAIWESNTFDFSIALTLFMSDVILVLVFLHLMLMKTAAAVPTNSGRPGSLLYMYLLLLAVSAACTVFALDKSLSVVEIAGMVRNVLIFVGIYYLVQTEKDLDLVATLLVAACTAQAVLILTQYGLDGQLIRLPGGSRELDLIAGGTVFRPGGTLGHSSHFAKLAAMSVPISFALFQNTLKPSRKFWLGLATAAMLLALMVCVSRIGLATSILGLGWVMSQSLKSQQGRRKFLASLAGCLVVLAFAWGVGGDRLMDRMANDENSAEARLPMWLTAAQVIVHNPQGVGLNNYLHEAIKYDDFGIVKSFPFPVHNIYLLYMAEIGILGGCVFIWLLISTVRHAFNASGVACSELDAAILKSLGVGLTCSWLQGLVGWGHRSSMIHLAYLAVIAGVVAAYSNMRNRNLRQPACGAAPGPAHHT